MPAKKAKKARKTKQVTASFFDKYAHEYDQMTNAQARTKPHTEEIRSLLADFEPTSVLDAGCGSGLTSMLIAREGVKAVGMDRERAMLKAARSKYAHLDLPLSFIQGSFEAPPKKLIGKFDLLVSLANGISGLGTKSLLARAMKSFNTCLKPGGTLVIQMLNFSSIKEDLMLPIRATRSNGILYIRYARRNGRRYSLHIVRIDNNGVEPTFEPFCHEFDNFSPAEVAAAVKGAGFVKIKRFSNIQRTIKFNSSARDLVLVARKTKN